MKKPKHRTKKLTRRENTLIEHLRTAKTFSEAALAASYSRKWPGQASYQVLKNIERKKPGILYELGLTVEALADTFEK